jgi:hypothetical protein
MYFKKMFLFLLLSFVLFACSMPGTQFDSEKGINQEIPDETKAYDLYSLPCWGVDLVSKSFTIKSTGYHTWEYGGSATPDIAHRFTIKVNSGTVAQNYPRTGSFYARKGDTLKISMVAMPYCYNPYNCYDWVFGVINVVYR